VAEPWEWTEDDLLQLITDQVQESLTLDYKAAPALEKTDPKKVEMSKDVSAFANSAGGTLVYGMVETGHLPTHLDNGYDPAEIAREWLEQVINTRIQRRIEGVRINQVALVKTHPNRVAYVVHVPQSDRAPHMAGDKRFYKRFNFQSVMMEEYEVRDVGYRLSGPDLSLGMRVGHDGRLSYGPAYVGAVSDDLSASVRLEIEVWNSAPTPADFAFLRVFLDKRLIVDDRGGWVIGPSPPDFQADVGRRPMQTLEVNWSHHDRLPIWVGMRLKASPFPGVRFPPDDGEYLYGWELHSPHMAVRRMLTGEIHVVNQVAVTVEPPHPDRD